MQRLSYIHSRVLISFRDLCKRKSNLTEYAFQKEHVSQIVPVTLSTSGLEARATEYCERESRGAEKYIEEDIWLPLTPAGYATEER